MKKLLAIQYRRFNLAWNVTLFSGFFFLSCIIHFPSSVAQRYFDFFCFLFVFFLGVVSSFNSRVIPLHKMPPSSLPVDRNKEDAASIGWSWNFGKVKLSKKLPSEQERFALNTAFLDVLSFMIYWWILISSVLLRCKVLLLTFKKELNEDV